MSKWKPVLMKLLYIAMVRSSLPEVFCKKGDLRNFVKHLCQSLFFNKVAGLNPAILLKERLAQVFYCEFYEISKNTFFTEHLRWLLLNGA